MVELATHFANSSFLKNKWGKSWEIQSEKMMEATLQVNQHIINIFVYIYIAMNDHGHFPYAKLPGATDQKSPLESFGCPSTLSQSLNPGLLSRDTGEGRWHPVFVAAPSDMTMLMMLMMLMISMTGVGMDHFSFAILDIPRKSRRFLYRFRAELFLGCKAGHHLRVCPTAHFLFTKMRQSMAKHGKIILSLLPFGVCPYVSTVCVSENRKSNSIW